MTEQVKYDIGNGYEMSVEYDECGITKITRELFESLIEKETPKKPKIVEVDIDGMDMETGEEYTYKIDEAHCINCDSVIDNEYGFDENYCNVCGQKIDWGE